jgi:hypothetical protein
MPQLSVATTQPLQCKFAPPCFIINCYAVCIASRASQKDRAAANARRPSVQCMGIDHCGFHIAVTQQLLNPAERAFCEGVKWDSPRRRG